MGDDEKRPTPERAAKKGGRSDAGAPADATEDLSAEEQMARYEEALKDEDWGHQPC